MRDPDSLFRRYLRRRDPALLAEVFDRTAPRLLRLAIHLVGGAAEAEDLVQDTFVTALERLEGFDVARGVEPWLVGILSNKARHVRRDAARSVDPERLLERAVDTPLEEAQRAELSGALAKALDRLAEPYRAVLVLRLRHGLCDADIAHVLERSPATVRVQVHRGLERLRRLLPVGLAALLVLPLDTARGLAAVREAVLAKAAAVPVAATTSALVGGALVTKKMLVAAAAVAALVIVTKVALRPVEPVAPAPAESAQVAAAPSELSGPPSRAVAPELAAAAAPGTASEPRREAAEAPPPEEARVPLTGRVIDAQTGEPLAGAEVALYEPRTMTLSALKVAEWPRVVQSSWDGSLRPFCLPFARTSAPDSQGFDWPRDTMLFDAEPVAVYDRPTAGEQPVARATASEDGGFTLPIPATGGTLVAEHEGYARRTVPAEQAAGEWTLALRRTARVLGVVETSDGPVAELALLLYGTVGERWEHDPKDDGLRAVPTWESWPVVTAEDGTFAADVSAEQVQVAIRTPGWFGQGSLRAGAERQRVYVVRAPVLRVLDAGTGEGIEHFTLIARELQNGYARFAGRYYALGGVHQLFDDQGLMSLFHDKTVELTVGAEGYRAARAIPGDLAADRDVVVELERGEAPSVRGTILDGGRPLADAWVALQPYGHLQWGIENERSIAAAVTREDGAFHLAAGEGDYLLRVQYGERVYAEEITLPDDAERVVDFASLGRAVVEIRDANGALQDDYTVVLGSDGGRNQWAFTGPDGTVTFEHLPDGPFKLQVPNVATKGSFSDAQSERFEITGGGTVRLAITVPVQGVACHPRVVTDPPGDLAGWRVRSPADREWQALGPDGTVPIDMAPLTWRRVEIAHPDGRRWQAEVPSDARDGYELVIALEGLRYTGTLLDQVSGEPLEGVRVRAAVVGDSAFRSASCVTDAEGRFSLACDRDVPHILTFSDDPSAPAWHTDESAFGGIRFKLSDPPSVDPSELTLRLPRRSGAGIAGLGERRLSGEVVSQASGQPVSGARVFLVGLVDREGGTMTLWTPTMTVLTGPDGAYDLTLPEADRYRLSVYPADFQEAALSEEWAPAPGEERRVLTIP